ncbi:MAG: DUF192 domain-containing protein [Candidatus Moranbacteria bacterium]|nr:DUF192 domain-containing protein [Candidatus Moranbacteria bacterium]
MSKIKKYVALLLAGSLLAFLFGYLFIYQYSVAGNEVVSIKLHEKTFRAEVVTSQQAMAKGLGQRDDLCENCGMLFEFPKAAKHSFWMKDMRFPLDIIWITQGKIVYIEKNVQSTFLETITPPENADMVLEINAGIVDQLGVKVGDVVKL